MASSDKDVAATPTHMVAVPNPVVPKISTQRKGKKSISKSTTPSAKSVVKSYAHSHSYYNDNERDMHLYAHRIFLAEKNFVLSDHTSFGVLILL